MKYLTIEQTAEALAVSTDTIRRMLPRLGAVDLNRGAAGRRLIRIPEESIRDYLSDCAILPPAPAPRAVKHDWKIARRR
jgi:excisionase family DNA binding protein